MNIALKVLSGPIQGEVIPLQVPLSIGRQGDIALDDPLLSRIHALIEQGPNGQWTVRDNDSKNGLKVGDVKMKSAELTVGIIFHIGETTFEVIALKRESKPVVKDPEPKPKAKSPAPAAQPEKPKKKQRYWNDTLISFLKTNKDAFKDKTNPLVPLEPALVLEFVRGIQTNAKWVLGFGPRKLGPGTVDLPIWEPNAPEICFEIQPTPDGILFKTEHSDIVKVNNQQLDSHVLRMGDTISIHDTLIEVDFSE